MSTVSATASRRRDVEHLPGDAPARLDLKRHGRGLRGRARARVHAVQRRPSAGRSPRPRPWRWRSGSESTPTLMTARRSVSISSSSRSCEITSTAAPLAASVIRAWWMAAAAPASTPQVGCETTSTPGFCSTSRPTTNFCRLPPDRLRASASMPGVRTSNSLDDRGSAKSRALPARMKPPASRPLRWRPLSTRVVDQAHLGHGGVAVALLGHAAQAELAPPRRRRAGRPACRRCGSWCRAWTGALAGQRQQQLVLAVAGDPGDAEDLAGADLEADALEVDAVRLLARQVEAVDGQARLAGPGTFAADQRAQLGADHQLRHALRGLDLGVAGGPRPCRRAGSWRGRTSALISCSLWLM